MAKRSSPAKPVATPTAAPPERTGSWFRRCWSRTPRPWRVLGGLLLVGLLVAAGLTADWYHTLPENRVATYVGSESCIACHQTQYRQWQGSHHQLAMQVASESTVLGDFSDIELEHHGATSRMYRQGDRFMVHTEGPDGQPADYEVKYVFGDAPLQNYMVEIEPPSPAEPGAIGRVQVLRETWDAEAKRWYYLMPPDVDEHLAVDDPLHWTGPAQNWNLNCAECHSTNLEKNFQLTSASSDHYHGAYHTTFTDINVACESCHGPGSIHVELAEANSLFWDRKYGTGLEPLRELTPAAEVDNCGTCHSRRRHLTQDFRPGDLYSDHYEYSLITEGTYYCDGQVRDEDYVYGSFLQSRMHQKGIRCTDCHDPHTAQLKQPGNAVCTSCHQHEAAKYDSPAHHHHRVGAGGGACVDCHMPERTYMGIDARRDHSLRVPRPDLSLDLNTPNACSQCHLADSPAYQARQHELPLYQDWLEAAAAGDEAAAAELARLDAWSTEAYIRWYGEPADRGAHFAHTFAQAWRLEPQALQPLAELVRDKQRPAIVRASAVAAMGPYFSPTLDISQPPYYPALTALRAALRDDDPRVRAAATATIPQLPIPPSTKLETLLSRAEDPVRVVRLEAATILASVPPQNLPQSWQATRENALEELVASRLLDADRPAVHVLLGDLHRTAGQANEAIAEYEMAIDLAPYEVGIRSQLAQLLELALASGAVHPDRVDEVTERIPRLRERDRELLARNVEQLPRDANLRYRYGLSLTLAGEDKAAESELQTAHQLEPNWPAPLVALAALYAEQASWDEALATATRLTALHPHDTQYAEMLDNYRARAERAAPPAP